MTDRNFVSYISVVMTISLGLYLIFAWNNVIAWLSPKDAPEPKETTITDKVKRIYGRMALHGGALSGEKFYMGREDTLYLYPVIVRENYTLEYQMTADSIAGAVNGIMYLQSSDAGLVWDNEDSAMINGSGRSIMQGRFENTRAKKIRFVAINMAVTQQTKITLNYAQSRDYN